MYETRPAPATHCPSTQTYVARGFAGGTHADQALLLEKRATPLREEHFNIFVVNSGNWSQSGKDALNWCTTLDSTHHDMATCGVQPGVPTTCAIGPMAAYYANKRLRSQGVRLRGVAHHASLKCICSAALDVHEAGANTLLV